MRMHSFQQRIFLIGLFGLVLANSSCQKLQNEKIMKTSSKKNDVTVEVSVPATVPTGQPVEMLVNITNAGPGSVFYMPWIRALGIHLVDSNNTMPELTPRGKSGVDSVIDYGINSATPTLAELKPGGHREWRVDLSALFILKPGKYRVSVKPEFSLFVPGEEHLFKISTDPIGFTIQ